MRRGHAQRAARERTERIKAALERLPELEAKKKAGEKDKVRCSPTDPEATVMKMADIGFRPAYNVQFSTATHSQFIVGVDVETTRSDAFQRADGGASEGAILNAAERGPGRRRLRAARPDRGVSAPAMGCTVYAPVPKPKDPQVDRHAP